ncbi:MAG TPA: glycosyltransferase [Pseudonocardiaceae bacterium]|nr:glycosyltransferase [Pseudonocardiaceae bacterium]
MRVALIGTRGVPARYGGFETAVEEIGAGLSELGHEVTVYCRSESDAGEFYRGMRRVTLPAVRRKALETITHSALSTLHALRHRPDVAIVFNAANAPFLAILRLAGVCTALHVDGHDARRRKWNGLGQRYYSLATRIGLKLAHEVIVDSAAIQQEFTATYGVSPCCIAYGASTTIDSPAVAQKVLDQLGYQVGGFHLVAARFEPENQVLEIIQSYLASDAQLPLLVVGFAGFPAEYDARIHTAAAGDARVRLLGPVWDQHLLDALYAGAASYLHGHSVGGTNPGLLRAMVNGAPILAFDCAYNRETTDDHALWFDRAERAGELMVKIELDSSLADELSKAALKRASHYLWMDVVSDYDKLLQRQRELYGMPPSGRIRRGSPR